MISLYRIVDLISDDSISSEYHKKFKEYGFDIKKDLKTNKISDAEYFEILVDLSEPILYTKFKGKLDRSENGEIFFRKLYVNFRNKVDLLRVIALVYIMDDDRATVFPFHIYLKSKKKNLSDSETKKIKAMMKNIEINNGELK